MVGYRWVRIGQVLSAPEVFRHPSQRRNPMTNVKIIRVSWLSITFAMGAGHTHAASPNVEAIARSCSGCHGSKGQGFGKLPSIRGMDQHRFIEAMQDFRNGTRTATVMHRIAKGFSDVELLEMADFFSEIP